MIVSIFDTLNPLIRLRAGTALTQPCPDARQAVGRSKQPLQPYFCGVPQGQHPNLLNHVGFFPLVVCLLITDGGGDDEDV